MKSFIAVGLLAVSLLAFLVAREVADQKRAASVMHLLCSEIQNYRQQTGELPPSLGAIAEGGEAGRLRNLTNAMSITYDPGSARDRMPRLTVSAGRTFIAVQGPDFDYPL